jgi:hypothetical protein
MMARNYLTFGDIDGKLDVLRAECIRCPRRGFTAPDTAPYYRSEGSESPTKNGA